MCSFPCVVLLLLFSIASPAALVSTDFRNPPQEYWPRPLWFWNDTQVTPEGIGEQLQRACDESGYGGVSILPFGRGFRPAYLSEDYFAAYGVAVAKARELGMKLSIYDEYGFPSGSAGAIHGDGTPRFARAHPDATIKRLDLLEQTVTGPGPCTLRILPGQIMSCVAMNTATFERRLIDAAVRDGKLTWEAPEGRWKIMVFLCVTDGDPNVDYLDPEACDKFIQMTHQPYFDRFGGDFGPGKTIDGVFFDEPTLYRAGGRMWTPAFNEKFEARHGFDPRPLYPALWYEIGPDTQAARNYLFGFRTELYAMGYAKRVQDWCREHGGIAATGHQDQEEIANPSNVSGDLMKCFLGQGIPGIDKIGGGRPTEKFYKVVSSAAHNQDKQRVMCETYGAMEGISLETMIHVALEQATKGINMIIPHALWYDTARVTFPPELSWRTPAYADELPHFTKFLARLHLMLQGDSRHVADIAMLYPIATLHGGNYLDGPLGFYAGGVAVPQADYADIGALLTDRLERDFTFLHPETLDEKVRVSDARMHLDNHTNRETYQVFLMPGQTTISWGNLQKIREFYDRGGRVIATLSLPWKSAEFGHDADVVAAISHIFPGASNFPAVSASSVWAAGGYSADHVIDGLPETRWNAANGTGKGEWLEVDFGKPVSFNRTLVREVFDRISSYEIQYWAGDRWVACASGGALGGEKIDKFVTVTAPKVRLYVKDISHASASIREFEIYDPSGRKLTDKPGPMISENETGGKSYFLREATAENLHQVLADALPAPDVATEGGESLRYLHKVREGRDIYLFANLGAEQIDTHARLRGTIVPELWDPHTGKVETDPEFTHFVEGRQDYTRVPLSLPATRAVFIVSKTSSKPIHP